MNAHSVNVQKEEEERKRDAPFHQVKLLSFLFLFGRLCLHQHMNGVCMSR